MIGYGVNSERAGLLRSVGLAAALSLTMASQASAQYSTSTSSFSTSDTAAANVVQTESTSAVVGAVTSILSGRISSFGTPATPVQTAGHYGRGKVGLAAGSHSSDLAGWTNFTYTKVSDDNAATSSNGDLFSLLFGVDTQATDELLVGAAFGAELLDMKTDFNGGSLTQTGFTVAPYLAYRFTDNISFDTSVGFSFAWLNMDRNAAGVFVDSNTTQRRWFISSNLNYARNLGNFSFRGQLGWLNAWSTNFAFTESNGTAVADSDVYLGQIRLGSRAGYFVDVGGRNYLEPFLKLNYALDVSREDVTVGAGQVAHTNDEDGLTFGGGMSFYSSDGLSVEVEGSHLFLREKIGETRGSATLRLKF